MIITGGMVIKKDKWCGLCLGYMCLPLDFQNSSTWGMQIYLWACGPGCKPPGLFVLFLLFPSFLFSAFLCFTSFCFHCSLSRLIYTSDSRYASFFAQMLSGFKLPSRYDDYSQPALHGSTHPFTYPSISLTIHPARHVFILPFTSNQQVFPESKIIVKDP